jgi:hypothetical protein
MHYHVNSLGPPPTTCKKVAARFVGNSGNVPTVDTSTVMTSFSRVYDVVVTADVVEGVDGAAA